LGVGFALGAAFLEAVTPDLEGLFTAVFGLAGSLFFAVADFLVGAAFGAVFFAVAEVLDSVALALVAIGFLTIAFLACTAVFNLTSPTFGLAGVTADRTKVPQ